MYITHVCVFIFLTNSMLYKEKEVNIEPGTKKRLWNSHQRRNSSNCSQNCVFWELCEKAVANKMQTRCKCHGMSGSCELKTCWKAAPDFRVVGTLLKDRYKTAIMVDQSNMGNGSPLLIHRRRRTRYKKRKRQKKRRRDLLTELLYYQKSPNFCETNALEDVDGTVGRQCNRTSRGVDSCGSLCCGRGYNVVKQRRTDRCHCRFHWCCYVVCQNCTVEEWITVCK